MSSRGGGGDERGARWGAAVPVRTNQRALIDKILARYCTDFSVYRELIQNSNDASARRAEVHFSTAPVAAAGGGTRVVVTEAAYRNDGAPFSAADWSRLTCIADGNPSPEKIGAFGVGAYSLFSLTENPMVCSGGTDMVFEWDGDALVTRSAKSERPDAWTSFHLPSRDAYAVPSMTDFGGFLASSLTFTLSLARIEVFVDGVSALCISKAFPRAPTPMVPPVENTWWSRKAIVLHSPAGVFSIAGQNGALTEREVRISARFGASEGAIAHISSRLIAADVVTQCSPELVRRMERVTKKAPMKKFQLMLLLADEVNDFHRDGANGSRDFQKARDLLGHFAPRIGAGRLFIGFRTSQTTGFAVHLAAPFIPTVERESIDLVDHTLLQWNGELLSISGAVMRLALEHRMSRIGTLYAAESLERQRAENLRLERIVKSVASVSETPRNDVSDSRVAAPSASDVDREDTGRGNAGGNRASFLSGLASFMGQAASEVKRIAISVADSINDDPSNLLSPADPQPSPSAAEREAIGLMQCFVPQRTTPDSRIGQYIGGGFERTLPNLSTPVLSCAGVVRGVDAFTATSGMQGFFKLDGDESTATAPLIRSVILDNATDYVDHVCSVPRGTLENLATHLRSRALSEDEALLLLVWFTQYTRRVPGDSGKAAVLKDSIRVLFSGSEKPMPLRDFKYFVQSKEMRNVPLPFETLPVSFTKRIPDRILREIMLQGLVTPLPSSLWSSWIVEHECMTAVRSENADAIRLAVFSSLALSYISSREGGFISSVRQSLCGRKCIPIEGGTLEKPLDSYLPIADLETFESQSRLPKVSSSLLNGPHVTTSFLAAIGVREAVSLDVLFSELDRLSWNQDPRSLIRYLCSVKSKLNRSEMQRLRESKFLPSTYDNLLHAPSELILPSLPASTLDEFSAFIPFLRGWREAGAGGADERRFLCDGLGMKGKPSLASVLSVASNAATTSSLRVKCIVFGASHLDFDSHACATYRFLPCRRRSPLKSVTETAVDGLCKASECFTDQLCMQMGFWAVRPELEVAASHFKVSREPTGQLYARALLDIVQALKNDTDIDDVTKEAKTWSLFTFLSSRVALFADREKATLRGSPFVPLWAVQQTSMGSEQKTLVWRRPGDLFFTSAESAEPSITSALFDTVPRNDFLRFVGTKDEPSLSNICELLVADSESVYERLQKNPKRYEELLYRIASQIKSLPRQLVEQLRHCSFLLATKLSLEEDQSGSDLASDPDVETDDIVGVQRVTCFLARAQDIYIIDDSFLQRMFNPPCLPIDSSGLEAFYIELGAKYISSAVSRRFRIASGRDGGSADATARTTEITMNLKKRILQRKALILETSQRRMRRGAPSLLTPAAFETRQVGAITAVYTLQKQSQSQPVSCCSLHNIAGRPPRSLPPMSSDVKMVLFVTDDVDFFDVADALGRQLYADERCGLQEIFLLAQLLETTLAQLRARGFPVDKIVKDSPPPESPSPPPSPSSLAATASLHTGVSSKPQSEAREPYSVRGTSGIAQDGYLDILCQMFPNVDPAWMQRKLAEHPGENGLRNLKSLLERDGFPQRVPPSTTPSGPSAPDEASRKGSGTRNTLSRSIAKAFRKRPNGGFSTLPGIGGSASEGKTSELPTGEAQNSGTAGDREPDDAKWRNGTRHVLNQAVRASSHVPRGGVSSAASQTVVPQDQAVSPACEVIPGQKLHPVSRGGVERAKTAQGLRVFVSLLDSDVNSSLKYCVDHWSMIERFSYMLHDLATIFQLDAKTMAIFYAKSGGVIAFNASGSLFFNLRYFATLHDADSRNRLSQEALIFWYTKTCHELAHNLAKDHNQRHGHYTEAFVESYFPRFLSWLKELGY